MRAFLTAAAAMTIAARAAAQGNGNAPPVLADSGVRVAVRVEINAPGGVKSRIEGCLRRELNNLKNFRRAEENPDWVWKISVEEDVNETGGSAGYWVSVVTIRPSSWKYERRLRFKESDADKACAYIISECTQEIEEFRRSEFLKKHSVMPERR